MDVQRFCRFCHTWFHVQCLEAEGLRIGVEAQSAIFASMENSLSKENERVFKLGLCPIIRGVESRYGVAGDILRIYQAYEIVLVHRRGPVPFSIPRHIPAFMGEEWYHCARCSAGFC